MSCLVLPGPPNPALRVLPARYAIATVQRAGRGRVEEMQALEARDGPSQRRHLTADAPEQRLERLRGVQRARDRRPTRVQLDATT